MYSEYNKELQKDEFILYLKREGKNYMFKLTDKELSELYYKIRIHFGDQW